MRRAFSIVFVIVVEFAVPTAPADTFTVTSTADSGAGTLRNAITLADTTPGTDTIAFNISGAGVHTIAPVSALPDITDPVIIDGYTQPGASPNTLANGDNAVLRIELNGSNAGNVNGLNITAGNSTVRGLVINRFAGNAIQFQTNGSNLVEGCFLGLDLGGTMGLANSGGVTFFSSGMSTVGGSTPAARNLISGNSGTGVRNLGATSSTNVIQGNYIGTDKTGTVVLANNTGISTESANTETITGNLISGNSNVGVSISGTGNLIQGNLIGTDVSGAIALGNGTGINIGEPGNTVGGGDASKRNIISGNHTNGVSVGANSGSNTIQGNYIGTNITGTSALGNTTAGISVSGAIGNPTAGTMILSNIISGNGADGISFNSVAGPIVKGNSIGTGVNGTDPIGNGGFGIDVFMSTDSMIGGTAAGEGNIIAFNGVAGVNVAAAGTINNSVLGNSIFSNTHLGIDLVAGSDPGTGVTVNDANDADDGPNHLQNFPVLTLVSNSGGMTTIAGRLNSAASTTYRIEFFANDSVDPSGYGEGKTFIGSKDVTTNGSGDASFNKSVTQIGANQRVTATATDPNGNTSEFSGAIGQLLNVSTRMEVLTGGSVLIGGFIIGGTGTKEVVLRALGPTLQNFGINGFLADPTMDLYDGGEHLIMSNDNWKDTQEAQIMATGKQPPSDLESAILHNFAPGNYTAIVRGKNNTTGVGLVEAYDIDNSNAITLTNISTRGFVDTGQNVMIGGFISGDGIVRVIVRALGPTLAQFGVPNVLADPVLDVRDAQGSSLATNDNWKDTQQAEIQASGKAPPNDLESAIIIVRPATNTTAIVSGKNNTTGNALVEAYILPP